jgi:DNA-binding transcriptional MerR regulator
LDVNALTEISVSSDSCDDSTLLTTGEMARCSQNTLRTVRFYEEEGILRPVRRTDGGHRLFTRQELDRLLFVTDMRAAGLSLDEIKHILEIKQRAQSCGEAAQVGYQILATRIGDLEKKMAVLTRLQQDLAATFGIMATCVHCNDNRGPSPCAVCVMLASQPTLPRSMRVLWSTETAQEHQGETNGT